MRNCHNRRGLRQNSNEIARWSSGLLNPGEQVKAEKCNSPATSPSRRASVSFFSHVTLQLHFISFLQTFSLPCVYCTYRFVSEFPFRLVIFSSFFSFCAHLQDCKFLLGIEIQFWSNYKLLKIICPGLFEWPLFGTRVPCFLLRCRRVDEPNTRMSNLLRGSKSLFLKVCQVFQVSAQG